MPKVIHLIPFHGIGGVEIAARSMCHRDYGPVDFEVMTIFPRPPGRLGAFNPFHVLRTARRLAGESPDLLILSLWRGALTGLLVRLLNRRIRMVLFLHNSRDAHPVDWLFTRWAASVSEEVWADSQATASMRLKRLPSAPLRVISFLVDRAVETTTMTPQPEFAFWGRLSRQKNLGSALRIVAGIRERRPDASFLVIGPDGGEQQRLRRLVHGLGLEDCVEFAGPMTREQIFSTVAKASFYLGTSRYEGMAMSVVEAMQLGLVPVVRPVGEIARYCVHGGNALLISSEDEAIEDVLALLADADAYARLRQGAVSTWKQRPLYSQSMIGAVNQLLGVGDHLNGLDQGGKD